MPDFQNRMSFSGHRHPFGRERDVAASEYADPESRRRVHPKHAGGLLTNLAVALRPHGAEGKGFACRNGTSTVADRRFEFCFENEAELISGMLDQCLAPAV